MGLNHKSIQMRKTAMEQLEKIVQDRGGSCNIEKYVNKKTPMTFDCGKGHEFITQPQTVRGGSWCKTCWRENHHLVLKDGLEQAQNIALQRGGRSLATSYKNNATPMLWECASEHQWFAAFSDVKRGTWCGKCTFFVKEETVRRYFETFTGYKFDKSRPTWLVNSRGNRMELDGFNSELGIAFEYQGEQHFKVVKHFQRRLNEDLVTRQLDDKQKVILCESNNVNLIVVSYKDSIAELILEKLLYYGVKVTPDQEGVKPNLSQYLDKLQPVREFVAEKGGEILSPFYLGVSEKHDFRCNCGHVWAATLANVKNGTWCPACKPLRISKSSAGKKWITDGVIDRKLLVDESVPDGWRAGRTNGVSLARDEKGRFPIRS